MFRGLLPRNLKRAIDLLRSDPARAWTIGALAASCNIPRRTLEKHFRRHLQQTPVEFLRTVRLDCSRSELLRTAPRATVMQIALQCGFNRFDRLLHSAISERPAITVLPFALLNPESQRAAGVSEEIAAALARLR
jgi:transcriptional regulator GlxA family with amidase domain